MIFLIKKNLSEVGGFCNELLSFFEWLFLITAWFMDLLNAHSTKLVKWCVKKLDPCAAVDIILSTILLFLTFVSACSTRECLIIWWPCLNGNAIKYLTIYLNNVLHIHRMLAITFFWQYHGCGMAVTRGSLYNKRNWLISACRTKIEKLAESSLNRSIFINRWVSACCSRDYACHFHIAHLNLVWCDFLIRNMCQHAQQENQVSNVLFSWIGIGCLRALQDWMSSSQVVLMMHDCGLKVWDTL